MRAIALLVFVSLLSVAGSCFAEDPLESLNTVEDTLSIMERSLQAQAWPGADGRGSSGAGDEAAGTESPPRNEPESRTEPGAGADGMLMAKPADQGDMVLLPEPGLELCPQ